MELAKNVQQQTTTTPIDADMHARAGDAELILRTTERQNAAMMVCVLPFVIRIACSLSSRLMAALLGAAATAGAAGATTPVGCVVTVAAVIVCQWLHHVRLWSIETTSTRTCAESDHVTHCDA